MKNNLDVVPPSSVRISLRGSLLSVVVHCYRLWHLLVAIAIFVHDLVLSFLSRGHTVQNYDLLGVEVCKDPCSVSHCLRDVNHAG